MAESIPALLERLCDDAATFPPGNLALADAVPAYYVHRASNYSALVGPFIIAAAALPTIGRLLASESVGSFEAAITLNRPEELPRALATAEAIPALRVVALEVAVPGDVLTHEVVPKIWWALRDRPDVAVFLELPRDERRGDLIARLADTPYFAKLRTGGVSADLYPDEHELATAVLATTRAGLPFKATAGLHHAVRNTDQETGFEQHGFLNLMSAVDAARAGADVAQLRELIAERAPGAVAEQIRGLAGRAPTVRAQFRSFGTCSIVEPLEEMTAMGVLDDLRAGARP